VRCDKCGTETGEAKSFEYVVAEKLFQVRLDRAQVLTSRLAVALCQRCFDETARSRHLVLLVPAAILAAATAASYALDVSWLGGLLLLVTLVPAGALALENMRSNGLDYEAHVLRPFAAAKARRAFEAKLDQPGQKIEWYVMTPDEYESVRAADPDRRP
jgi:hypothetical protein